ncbi:Bug family tripartite tricarboxylate transporter substrate binding protein [Ottowia thiooxydans]|uniref:Bug family tripartite tricarboxylate transporter substrate binding protein n=1 Tax=Ottowia thiooxydans TaxID=219182 RepID=UPI0006869861|nr:tripartite tricarboxylate transporter substrate binding protein [Ottowia thiooxydans]
MNEHRAASVAQKNGDINMRLKLLKSTATALIMWAAATGASFSQTWPAKPIELVHGFAAGGQADIVARLIAQGLTERLKSPVVVVSRSGAGGNLASESVTRATPDGHTLILLTGGHAVSAALYKNLKFDPVKDFAFVSPISINPFVLVVRKDSAITDIASLIAAAKKQPGRITYSSVGIGSTQHLVGELFASSTDTQLTHVPYRGGGAPMADLLGGQIDLNIDSIAATRSAIESGRARAIGITSADKWPTLPSIEPVSAVQPGFAVTSWIGIAAPAATPQPIVSRLNTELQSLLADQQFQQRLLDNGSRVNPGSPEDLRRLVTSEIDRWTKVISKAGIERN